ncbi:MAG: site-specific integrase [Nitrospiraceae bacterium]|nr:site-specific integrase [Nitrospiraceae bacterium]
MRLFKRSDNGIWYVEFDRDQKRSLRTKDEATARDRLRDIKKKLFRGNGTLSFLPENKEAAISVSDYLDMYKAWADSNLADTTRSRMYDILEKFKEVTGGQKSIHSLDFADLDRYVEYCRLRKNKPGSINTEIRHIKAAFGWGANPGRKIAGKRIFKVSPFSKYKLIRYHKSPPAFLTIEEIQTVFDRIGGNRHYRLVFALYVYTGARREEIHRLEWKDIRTDVVEIRRAKGYKSRAVPISDRLRDILAKYPASIGRVVNVSLGQMAQQIKYYLKEAGVGHVRPHDLRHTFASHLVMAGVDLKTVGELLGHTSYQATMIYAHLLKEHKVKAIQKLPY